MLQRLKHAALLIPLTVVLVTGFMGIDFGWHWDEGNKVEEVAYTLEQGVLLPTYYRKPSLIYWLTLTTTLPEVPTMLDQIDWDGANYDDDRPLSLMPALAERIRQPDFMLRVRGWFLLVSSSLIVATYALVYRWRDSWLQAIVAACVVAFSWEVAYHLRFVAPDGYLTTFTVLTVLCSLVYFRQRTHSWLVAAAIMAGLTIGSKYNAWAILLVPLSALLLNPQLKRGVRLRQIIIIVFITGVTFTVTTPGILLAPEHFLRDVLFELNHYSSGSVWDTNHDIRAGLPHLHANIDYLMWSAFSPYGLLSAGIFGVALVGWGLLWRENWREALIFSLFPTIYLLYMSSQSVFFVRNMLPIVPFVAVAVAFAVGALMQRVRPRVAQAVLGTGLVAVCAVNGIYLVQTAQTIQQRGSEVYLTQFVDYAKSQPEQTFAISQQIQQQFDERDIAIPENVQFHAWESADVYALRHSEFEWAMPTDARHLVERWFGVHDLNLRYYPRWKGNDHILLLNPAAAEHYNLLHHYEAALD